MGRLALVLVLLTIAPAKGLAAENSRLTGNDFIVACKAAEAELNNTYNASVVDAQNCISYIAGYRDALAISPSPYICIPFKVTNGQLVRVYVAWAAKNPDQLHLDISTTVANALFASFPCAPKT